MSLNNMKSISEYQKEGLGIQLRKNLSLAWYFEKVYEKVILILLSVLGFWKFFELMGRLF